MLTAMLNTPIHDFLQEYAASDSERCHTPGHKGILNRFDITEIPDSAAIEVIKESECNAADLFGAGRTLFSTSGSTLAIYAMLSFCANRRVTAFRKAVHRSFVDAAILLGFDVDWVYEGESISDCVTAETAAVFVTNIDYYGNMQAIRAIADLCKGLNLPLLVDNAHGAYLVFTDCHPIRLGAAMSADSAHKTLPALTGAAYLHISKAFFAEYAEYTEQAESAMELFGTSSPSYLILESLDLCNRHIALEKAKAESAFEAVRSLKQALCEIGYSLISPDSDLLRIVVDVNAYGYSGGEYAAELRKRGIVCEMFDFRLVILLFSTVTQKKNTQRVLDAMQNIDFKIRDSGFRGEDSGFRNEILNPKTYVLKPATAYFSPKRKVPILEAVGEVVAGIHVTTPPCTPIVIPGETVTQEAALLLQKLGIDEILINL